MAKLCTGHTNSVKKTTTTLFNLVSIVFLQLGGGKDSKGPVGASRYYCTENNI